MKFITNFRHALSDKDFKKKVMYVLIPVIMYMVGALIPLPNVDVDKMMNADLGAFDLIRIMVGGQLKTFSLFALGVSPIITTSIVLHLLSAHAFPVLRELQTGGKEDRKKFEYITIAVTVLLAALQGYTTIKMFDRSYGILVDNSTKGVLITLTVMIIGVMLLYGVAKYLEKKEFYGGLTIFIATGIIASLPSSIKETLAILHLFKAPLNWIFTIIYILAYVGLVWLIVWFSKKQVKVPVIIGKSVPGQNASVRRAEKRTFIPLSYNPSGVMPIIIASSVLSAPMIIASWIAPQSRVYKFFADTLSLNSYLGVIVFGVLVVMFAYIYNQIQIAPDQVADNFKKEGTYMLGVRPGKDTAMKLREEVFAISKYSAMFLFVVGVIPMFLPLLTKGIIPSAQAFGGTGLIILVDVMQEVFKSTESAGTQARYKNIGRRSSIWG